MKTISIIKLFFLLAINSTYSALAQEKIIDCNNFTQSHFNNKDLIALSTNYNLLYILLLDSTKKDCFFKHRRDLKDLYEDYSYGIKTNTRTIGFVTEIDNVKKIFDSKLLIQKMYNTMYDSIRLKILKPMIYYPVYTKNNAAIVEILTNNGSDVYYIKLDNRVVQINWLSGTIE